MNEINPYCKQISSMTETIDAFVLFANEMWSQEKKQVENEAVNNKLAKDRGCVCAINPDYWVDSDKKEFILNRPYFQIKLLEIGDRVCLGFMFEDNPKTVDIEVVSIRNNILSKELKYYSYKIIENTLDKGEFDE